MLLQVQLWEAFLGVSSRGMALSGANGSPAEQFLDRAQRMEYTPVCNAGGRIRTSEQKARDTGDGSDLSIGLTVVARIVAKNQLIPKDGDILYENGSLFENLAFKRLLVNLGTLWFAPGQGVSLAWLFQQQALSTMIEAESVDLFGRQVRRW